MKFACAMLSTTSLSGRSPCGERGLKYLTKSWRKSLILSLPVRGAWVEIELQCLLSVVYVSLPVRGAWVEIASRRF